MKPRQAIAISVLVVLGTVTLVILTMPFWGGWLLKRSLQDTYAEISKVNLACESGSKQVIEGWSKAGYSVSCRRNEEKDGPWQAWEGSHISITGYYAKGKEDGTWLIYTDNGKSIYRTITYKDGKELSNVVH